MRSTVLSALLAALLAVALLATLVPLEGFWITDDANRFIQTANFAAHARVDIVHPGGRFDPAGRHVPLGGHHFQRRDGRLYSFYPFVFPLLAWPLYALAGTPGLYVLPVLGFAACAALLALGLVQRDVSPRHAPWLAVALTSSTPLVFYALTFWEHTLAAGLFAGGTWLAFRAGRLLHAGFGSWAGAGALLGAATVLREEGYVLTAAFALGWAVSRPGRRSALWGILAGWTTVLLPWWAVNLSLFGNPLGLHAAVYAALPGPPDVFNAAGRLTDTVRAVWVYLLQWHPDWRWAVAGSLPLVFAVFAGLAATPGARTWWLRIGALALAAAGCATLTTLTLLDPAPLAGTLYRQSLLPGVPVAALVLVSARSLWKSGTPASRCLLALCAAGVGGLCLSLRTADMGIIWGPRHFLMLVPALLILAWEAAEALTREAPGRGARNLARGLIATLLGIGLLLQAHGIGLLAARKRATRDLAAAVTAMRPAAVVTDVFWVPEELAAIYLSTPVFDAADDAGVAEVLDRVDTDTPGAIVVLALSPRFSRLRETDLPDGAEIVARLRARTPRVEFLELVLYACRLHPNRL